MKTTILFSIVTVGTGFVPQANRRDGMGLLTPKMFSLPEDLNVDDLSKPHNLDGDFHQSKALKSGAQFTRRMRQAKVDHDEELERITQNILRLLNQKAYVALAYSCMEKYVSKGSLSFTCGDEIKKDIDFAKFDMDLMNSCLAKYGMQCEELREEGYALSWWVLELTLQDDEDKDDEQDED